MSLLTPEETVSKIVVPTLTVLSASGVWLMTRPYSTLSLVRLSLIHILRDGMHVYFPAVSREDAAARQTRDLLGRVYHGSLSLLVSAMTREEALSKAEIDELYAILDEMEAKQSDA